VELVARRAEDVLVVLSEISVQNVALIESAALELAPGLNAVSGETGAGKTLLATALQMLLGGAPAPKPSAPAPKRPPSKAASCFPKASVTGCSPTP
jgi:DNA repair protein RecN (Recombination protein N)